MSRWPDTETHRLLALYDDGLSVQEIALKLGRPETEVRRKRDEMGSLGYLSSWERRQTAVHEAAHAVALAMRGGTGLWITIYPIGQVLGRVTHDKLPTADNDFVAFAGPWASARYQWEWDQTHEDDGASFEDYLAHQMEEGSYSDLQVVHRLVNRYRKKLADIENSTVHPDDLVEGLRAKGYSYGFRTATEVAALRSKYVPKLAEAERAEADRNALWDIELERVWPVVNQVADVATAGQPVTDAVVRQLLDELEAEAA